jgi:formyl-CoA transferase
VPSSDQVVTRTGPLARLKVVEIAQLIAGSMPGALLADLGADVVHVEDVARGDPVRSLGPRRDGAALWWKVAARNKRSVTIDLRQPEGQDIARRLAAWADVVISNFRIGTLERWQLDFDNLLAVNPKLIMLQVSALGSTGPGRDVPGFGKIGEARSGVAHLSGEPGGAPVFSGFLLSDSVTALMGALAVEMALYRRAHDVTFAGEWIDATLTEPLFRLVDWQSVIHDQTGEVPSREGNEMPLFWPALANTFATAGGAWILVTASNTDEMAALAAVVGESEGDYSSWKAVGESRPLLDAAVAAWASPRAAADALRSLASSGVTASKIFNVADIFADPIYAERGAIIDVPDADLGSVRMQGVVPRFVEHPGGVWRTGPALGEDTDFVLREYLAMNMTGDSND